MLIAQKKNTPFCGVNVKLSPTIISSECCKRKTNFFYPCDRYEYLLTKNFECFICFRPVFEKLKRFFKKSLSKITKNNRFRNFHYSK